MVGVAFVFNERLTTSKHGAHQEGWQRARRDKAFDLLRHRVIIETEGEVLMKVLQ